MTDVRPGGVLAGEGKRPGGGVEGHQQHEAKCKTAHGQAKAVESAVASLRHAAEFYFLGRLYCQFGSRAFTPHSTLPNVYDAPSCRCRMYLLCDRLERGAEGRFQARSGNYSW